MTVYTYSELGNCGRLGNQLWQIAWQVGQAEERGNCRASISGSWSYRKFFEIPDMYYVPPSQGDDVVDGSGRYFQEIGYWARAASHVCELFQPSEYLASCMQEAFGEILQSGRHKTALHVRRGDYLKKSADHPVLGMDYYCRAIRAVRNVFPCTEIYVFSDDIAWCKSNFQGEFMFVDGFLTPQGDPQDIYELTLMTKMNSHIIANSSFSWWGARLSSDAAPIYPPIWSPLTRLDKMIPISWQSV